MNIFLGVKKFLEFLEQLVYGKPSGSCFCCVYDLMYNFLHILQEILQNVFAYWSSYVTLTSVFQCHFGYMHVLSWIWIVKSFEIERLKNLKVQNLRLEQSKTGSLM